MAKDAKVAARTKRASKKSTARLSKKRPGRLVAVAKPPTTPKIFPQLMTTDEAIAELTELKKRFRDDSAQHHGELLHGRWETAVCDNVMEGELWLPSPSQPNVMLQGFIYLGDEIWYGQPAWIGRKQAEYSLATDFAAKKLRELASVGGGIITRIPAIKSELNNIVCGEGAGGDVEDARWWFAFLFRNVATSPQRREFDMGMKKGRGWTKGPTHEVELKKMYLNSEAACEMFIGRLKAPLTQTRSRRASKIEFRRCRHFYLPPIPSAEAPAIPENTPAPVICRSLGELRHIELRDVRYYMRKALASNAKANTVRQAIRDWSSECQRVLVLMRSRNDQGEEVTPDKSASQSLPSLLPTSDEMPNLSIRDKQVLVAAVHDALAPQSEPRFDPWASEPETSRPEISYWFLFTYQLRELSPTELQCVLQAFEDVCSALGLGHDDAPNTGPMPSGGQAVVTAVAELQESLSASANASASLGVTINNHFDVTEITKKLDGFNSSIDELTKAFLAFIARLCAEQPKTVGQAGGKVATDDEGQASDIGSHPLQDPAIATEGNPSSGEFAQPEVPFSPAAEQCRVTLRGANEGPLVNGKAKKKLPTKRYQVVAVLVQAWPKSLTKGQLEEKSTDYWRMLTELAQSDEDWKSVIHFPGEAWVGYRIG